MPESKTAEQQPGSSGAGPFAAFAWRSLAVFTEGNDRMYAYCLFCETQRCKIIAYLLERYGIAKRAFSPQIIKRARVRGKNVDKPYDLLPGYVFLFSETPLEDFTPFYGIMGILRRVGDPEKRFVLSAGDLDFAQNLLRKDGTVGQMTVFKVGDEVRLDDPLFNGVAGKITRIDYRKQRARVDYHFAGMECFTWVAVDVIRDKEKQCGDAVGE
jgi:transcription antitermination factor NusG